ncbi:hypothetical protein ACFFK0_26175 [Paenibacillus chartarius]|uniref:Uncharacterized protein n=1 Tax=Paenibacillus chartarius TaxID=747481 RepID=A0ABV6DTB2_9BACL
MTPMKKYLNLTLSAALAATLCAGSFAADGNLFAGRAHAAEAAAVLPEPLVGIAKLDGARTAEVRNMYIIPGASSTQLTFKVRVYNNDDREMFFMDYGMRVFSADGGELNAKLLAKDKSKNRIGPHAYEDFTYAADIPLPFQFPGVTFKFVMWDMNYVNYERPLSQIVTAADYSFVTPQGRTRVADVAGTQLEIGIPEARLSRNERNWLPTVWLTLNNVGIKSIEAPGVQAYLRAADGALYPLTMKPLADKALNPRAAKRTEWTATVPATVPTEGWQVVLTEPESGQTAETAEPAEVRLPIATLELPAFTSSTSGQAQTEYAIQSATGLFGVTLNALERMPWEENDLVSADITLVNKGEEALPLPELLGYFLLDGKVKVEAKAVRLAEQIGIAPQGQARIRLYGKIPYTYSFAKAKLVLQEKEKAEDGGTDRTVELLTLESDQTTLNMPLVAEGQSWLTTNAGREAELTVRKVQVYESELNDLYVAELLVRNQGLRPRAIGERTAFLKMEGGALFPATLTQSRAKLAPTGRALVTVSAVLPKGLVQEGKRAEALLVGDSVTDGALTASAGTTDTVGTGTSTAATASGGTETAAAGTGAQAAQSAQSARPDAYVNAAMFALPAPQRNTADTLLGLELYPFTVSFSKFASSVDFVNSQLTIRFHYKLGQDPSVLANTEGRKVILEFVDGKDSTIKFTQELSLGAAYAKEGALTLGEADYEFMKVDKQMVPNMSFSTPYTLNVYDVMPGGERRLVAAQKLSWLSLRP